MQTLFNYLVCSAERKGTGVPACYVETDVPNGFYLAAPNWSFDPSQVAFNRAYVTEQIQAKNLIPFLNSLQFTDNTEDDVFQTFATGIKAVVRNGLPEFAFDYSKGYCFHSAAHSYNSYAAYKVVFVWNNGVHGFAKNSDGTLSGLDMGYFKAGTYKNNSGSETQTTPVSFQLTNAIQYNENMAFLSAEQLDFVPSNINGVVDAMLTIQGDIEGTDTTFDVAVKVHCNTSINVLGLTVADLQLTGDTSKSISTVAYNSSTGLYTITMDAPAVEGELIGIRLYDTADDYTVVDLSGTLYEGESEIKTVAPTGASAGSGSL